MWGAGGVSLPVDAAAAGRSSSSACDAPAALAAEQAWLRGNARQALFSNLRVRSARPAAGSASDASAGAHAIAASSCGRMLVAPAAAMMATASAAMRIMTTPVWPTVTQKQAQFVPVPPPPPQVQAQKQALPLPASSFQPPGLLAPSSSAPAGGHVLAAPRVPFLSTGPPPESRFQPSVGPSAFKQSLQRSIPPTQQSAGSAHYGGGSHDDIESISATPSQTAPRVQPQHSFGPSRAAIGAPAVAAAPLPLPLPAPSPPLAGDAIGGVNMEDYAAYFDDDEPSQMSANAASSSTAMLPASAFQRPGSTASAFGGSSNASSSGSTAFAGSYSGSAAAFPSSGGNYSSSHQQQEQQQQQQQLSRGPLQAVQQPGQFQASRSQHLSGPLQYIEVSNARPKPASAGGSDVSEWASTHFPWAAQVAEANQCVFGNTGFRTHQREAINASLAGKDTFVLMPTGAGR